VEKRNIVLCMVRGLAGSTTIAPTFLNPLNAKLNPICHLLALLGAHHILHVSRIRVNIVTVQPNASAALSPKEGMTATHLISGWFGHKTVWTFWKRENFLLLP
jgi:hypothetical protein